MIQKLTFIALFTAVVGLGSAYGQVTVGSNIAPAKGALLEIKSEETANPTSVTDATNVTSTKGGLGLSRVQLVSLTTLQPFIGTSDAEWTGANLATTKMKHAGLMVYNLNETSPFKKGVYVWNGEKWTPLKMGSTADSRYFYVPSFNIPLATPGSTELTFDLYAQYKNQFTKAGNDKFVSNNSALTTVPSPDEGQLYAATELDYIITYYDDAIIEVTSLTNDGKMKYKVNSVETTPNSFINVVFVVKE
ncbi:hypothetical protein [Parabacteroides sp. PF5-9]|uniref:hypothetical protein n=1 Tax=Parabacteroides sp. PF5-9 TaxID=1742404 RepID=UPI0024755D1A|nr:hypothetical protein [Parabacteroides sp. PF5-9]MDH6358698.1 hypothetical protein [Parabacteroides sp. PF5-9]